MSTVSIDALLHTKRQATGIGGVGGYFEIPPLAEKFWKIPPLEILGKIFEKPGKTEKIR